MWLSLDRSSHRALLVVWLLAVPAAATELVVEGTAGDDGFVLQLDAATGRRVEIWHNGQLRHGLDEEDLTSITIDGLHGDDAFTIDYANGFFHAPTTVNGGDNSTPSGDLLIVQGRVPAKLTSRYAPGPPDRYGKSGALFYETSGDVHVIHFTGLEPIEDLVSSLSLTIDTLNGATTGPDTITVLPGPAASGVDPLTNNSGELTYQVDFAGAAEVINFRNKSQLVVEANAGSDQLTLDLPSKRNDGLGFITLLGGDGADTLTVANAPGGVTVSASGGNDSDTLNVRATALTNQTEVSGGQGNDQFNVGSTGNSVGEILGTLVIDGGEHLSTLGWLFCVTANLTTVCQETPVGDTLDFNDQGTAAGPFTYTLGPSSVERGSVGRVVTYANVETINLNTGLSGHAVALTGIAPASATFVTMQAAIDSVSGDASGASSSLAIDTGAGADSVHLTDTGVESVTVASGGDGTDILTLESSGTGSGVQFDGMAGADTLNLWSVAATGVATIFGGDNSDTVNLGNPINSLAALDGEIEVHGGAHGAGTLTLTIGGANNTLLSGDILNLNDQGDAGSYSSSLSATTFSRDGMAGTVSYQTIETININASSGASTVTVSSTADFVNTSVTTQAGADSATVAATGSGSNVTITSAAGDDTVTVDGLGGFLLVTGGAGSDSLQYQAAPGTYFPTSSVDGYIVPSAGARVGYESVESANGAFLLDFGDLPDPAFPTLLASDGARHAGDGTLRLGQAWDGEVDGQPGATASGDADDEDGVTFTSAIELGPDSTGASLDVVASALGQLDGWIDFNADGDLNDDGEQVFSTKPVSGTVSTSFSTSADAVPGLSFGRFRLSSLGGLAATGLAADGEVEDYPLTLEPPLDLDLFNRVDSGPKTFWACRSISAGDPSGYQVLSGTVTFHAGSSVALRNGFEVASGAGFSLLLGAIAGCSP